MNKSLSNHVCIKRKQNSCQDDKHFFVPLTDYMFSSFVSDTSNASF